MSWGMGPSSSQNGSCPSSEADGPGGGEEGEGSPQPPPPPLALLPGADRRTSRSVGRTPDPWGMGALGRRRGGGGEPAARSELSSRERPLPDSPLGLGLVFPYPEPDPGTEFEEVGSFV